MGGWILDTNLLTLHIWHSCRLPIGKTCLHKSAPQTIMNTCTSITCRCQKWEWIVLKKAGDVLKEITEIIKHFYLSCYTYINTYVEGKTG